MPLPDEKIKIAVFAGSAAERDYLRNCIVGIPATVLCFENETIIIDNYKSILPDIVIARTDSNAVAWRFIFAMHAVEADSTLLIASDTLNSERFDLPGISIFIQCIPIQANGVGIQEVVQQVVFDSPPEKEKAFQPLWVGGTEAINQTRAMLPSLKRTRDPVLISGEGGTGKELLARLIASDTPSSFVKLNCAKLAPKTIAQWRVADNLLSNFQHASNHKKSSVQYPLVFLLDKINMLHPQAQSEMLLLLEMVSRSDNPGFDCGNADVRFIAISDKNLEQLLRRGEFRKDLFYRINVIPINLPPLRERKQDIPLLIDYFVIDACVKTNRSYIAPSNGTMQSLYLYDWPGNLDELKRLMDRMVVAGDETFINENYAIPNGRAKNTNDIWQSFDSSILPDATEIKQYLPNMSNYSLKSICDTFVSRTEKKLMQKALESTNWNRKKAAELLNISYKSMLNKIKAYDIM